jgi:hypothetical protein
VLALQPVLLRRAAEIKGGVRELCEYLEVSYARMELWQAGKARLPDPIFLKAVDLVLRDDIARASHDRRQRLRDDETRSGVRPPEHLAR